MGCLLEGRFKPHNKLEIAARRVGVDECLADATVLVAIHAPHFFWSPGRGGMTEPFGHHAEMRADVKIYRTVRSNFAGGANVGLKNKATANVRPGH
jgi:hypothetical protein